jgi:hypothetical protein
MDYAPGEKYHEAAGVLTCAERLPNGLTRLFYFYPEAFPELYQLRTDRIRVAQEAVQKLMAMAAE